MKFFSVFGEFYSKLYADANESSQAETQNTTNFEERCAEEGKQDDESCNEEIPEITDGEMQSAIKKLKKGKACDNNGISAADIKDCDESTREMIRQIFNEVIRQKDCIPETWRRVRIKVIHKKGSEEDVGNYRRICTLPALYKLFSTILYSRLYPRLDVTQPEDIPSNISNSGPLDDAQTERSESQKWCVKLLIATIDFMKAFDSTRHSSIWKALKTCGIERSHINLLKKQNSDQKATVMTDRDSDIFEIKRGTKQGDLLSSLLFNTLLQMALKDDINRWQKKRGMGISLRDQAEDSHTNLRFADDVMLFATSLEQLQKMLSEFKKSTPKVFLKIHPGKTKILSNQSSNRNKKVQIDDIQVEVLLKEESTKYLGQLITFQQQETKEIKNGIRAAWASFQEYRQEVTSRHHRLQHRLQLFNMVFTPTMNYASGTWTKSEKHEKMIQSTQRKTLRLIVQTKRKYKKKKNTENEEEAKNKEEDYERQKRRRRKRNEL